jgi:hypothetical protein
VNDTSASVPTRPIPETRPTRTPEMRTSSPTSSPVTSVKRALYVVPPGLHGPRVWASSPVSTTVTAAKTSSFVSGATTLRCGDVPIRLIARPHHDRHNCKTVVASGAG